MNITLWEPIGECRRATRNVRLSGFTMTQAEPGDAVRTIVNANQEGPPVEALILANPYRGPYMEPQARRVEDARIAAWMDAMVSGVLDAGVPVRDVHFDHAGHEWASSVPDGRKGRLAWMTQSQALLMPWAQRGVRASVYGNGGLDQRRDSLPLAFVSWTLDGFNRQAEAIRAFPGVNELAARGIHAWVRGPLQWAVNGSMVANDFLAILMGWKALGASSVAVWFDDRLHQPNVESTIAHAVDIAQGFPYEAARPSPAVPFAELLAALQADDFDAVLDIIARPEWGQPE